MNRTLRKVSRLHRHRAETRHVIAQRDGVPYELERRLCTECGRVLEERPVKRAEAA
jgi:hypothetical protein